MSSKTTKNRRKDKNVITSIKIHVDNEKAEISDSEDISESSDTSSDSSDSSSSSDSDSSSLSSSSTSSSSSSDDSDSSEKSQPEVEAKKKKKLSLNSKKNQNIKVDAVQKAIHTKTPSILTSQVPTNFFQSPLAPRINPRSNYPENYHLEAGEIESGQNMEEGSLRYYDHTSEYFGPHSLGGHANLGAQLAKGAVLAERAKRFGMEEPVVPKEIVTQKHIQDLYKSLEIIEDDFVRGGWRAEAIHVQGFNVDRNEEMFNYFVNHKPQSVEWLTDNSCNIVYRDHLEAVQALCALSCPIEKKNKTKDGKKSEKKKKAAAESNSDSDTDSSSSDSSDSDSSSDSSDDSEKENDSKGQDSSQKKNDSQVKESEKNTEKTILGENVSSMDVDETTAINVVQHNLESNDQNVENNIHNLENGGKNRDTVENNQQSVENVENSQQNPADENMECGEIAVRPEDIGKDLPIGRWRLGIPCPNTELIIMRFAHCKDKKNPAGIDKPLELYEHLKTKDKKKKRKPAREERPIFKPNRNMDRLPQREYIRDKNSDFKWEDLDDPHKSGEPDINNPWGFLASSWNRREWQDHIDYHAMLKDYVKEADNKRKRRSDDSDLSDGDTFPSYAKRRKHKRNDSHYARMQLLHSDIMEKGSRMSLRKHDERREWKSKMKLPVMKMYADTEAKRTRLEKDMGSRLESQYPRPRYSSDQDFKDYAPPPGQPMWGSGWGVLWDQPVGPPTPRRGTDLRKRLESKKRSVYR